MSRKPKNHYLDKILSIFFLRQKQQQQQNNNNKTLKFSKVRNLSKMVENIP